MFLEIGNVERINDPSPEQIGYSLRNLPVWTPFLILSADEDLFIQATVVDNAYHVELWQDGHHRSTQVSADRAEQLFLAFRCWDQSEIESEPWRPYLTLRNVYRYLALLALLLFALAVANLWFFMH